MTIESSKTLGGIGAILLILFLYTSWWASGFSGIIGLAGAILVLLALNGLANEYRERRVFNNALYGVILVIVAFGILSVLGIHVSNWLDPNAVQSAFQNFNPLNMTFDINALAPYIGAAAVAFIILFLCFVFSAVFIARAVHIDPFGYVHVCQGITMGNMKKTPLHLLFEQFDPYKHPVCKPILKGGPAELVRKYHTDHEEGYVDECHLCYSTRLELRKMFPEILAPDQMYGVFT